MQRLLRRAALWSLALCLAGLGFMVVLGLREASAPPVMRQTTVHLPDWPQDARPLRIALLSDIHIGNRAMAPARLTQIVAQIDAARPDLVVIAGDFVNGHDPATMSDPQQLVAPLSRLRARLGVIATLGNHEHWTDPDRVRAALEQAGVTVLANQPLDRGPITILGIDDGYSGHADIAGTMAQVRPGAARPLIAVSHSPDLAPRLPGPVHLLLAGHTHCGQMVLPLVGSLAIQFGRLVGDRHYYDVRYQCGAVREGARTTIVTAGLGSGSIPLRLGAPPDWWMVTLAR